MKYDFDSSIVEMQNLEEGMLCLVETPKHYLSSKSSKKGRVFNARPYIIKAVMGDNVLLIDLQGKYVKDLISRRRIKIIDAYRKNFPVDTIDNESRTVLGCANISENLFERSNQLVGGKGWGEATRDPYDEEEVGGGRTPT